MNKDLYKKATILETEMTMLGIENNRLLAKTRTAIRNYFGFGNSIPIELTNKLGITYSGQGLGYTTRGGTLVRHPSAYSKVGWSNLVYHHSTREIICNKTLFWIIAVLVKAKNKEEIKRILENEKY